MRILSEKKPLIVRLAVFLFLLAVVGSMPLRSGAHTATTSVTIVNESSREIRHVYLSPVEQNDWGPDQLSNYAVIAAGGGTFTMANVACDSQSIKVIAEDHEGCFFYQVVSCGGASTWTITNAATPDCGG